MPAVIEPSPELHAELAQAFATLRPKMLEHAAQDADLDPSSRLADFSQEELGQFLNAYEALFMEALEGGRQTREFILETALPPILAMGQTSLELLRGNVVSAVMLTSRILPLISEELRHDAARWLAAFQSSYAYDLAERALAIEGERA